MPGTRPAGPAVRRDRHETFKTITMIKKILLKLLCFIGVHDVNKHYSWPVGYVNKNCKRKNCSYHVTVKDEEGYYNHVVNKK